MAYLDLSWFGIGLSANASLWSGLAMASVLEPSHDEEFPFIGIVTHRFPLIAFHLPYRVLRLYLNLVLAGFAILLVFLQLALFNGPFQLFLPAFLIPLLLRDRTTTYGSSQADDGYQQYGY